jgi:hypothetical protein
MECVHACYILVSHHLSKANGILISPFMDRLSPHGTCGKQLKLDENKYGLFESRVLILLNIIRVTYIACAPYILDDKLGS